MPTKKAIKTLFQAIRNDALPNVRGYIEDDPETRRPPTATPAWIVLFWTWQSNWVPWIPLENCSDEKSDPVFDELTKDLLGVFPGQMRKAKRNLLTNRPKGNISSGSSPRAGCWMLARPSTAFQGL